MAGVGHFKRIWKDAFGVAGAVQDTQIRAEISWERLHFGAWDRQVCGKIAKLIGTRPTALHSTFHFWRKSRRIASFLMLSSSKNWRSLAEPFRFWCCQVQELRKSRRIVSFLTLSSSKLRSSRRIAAFSILQVDRQIDRQLPLPLQTQGKQDAAHEPECSHVKHFCETSDLNSVVHFSPVTVPVHCRLRDPEEGRVQSAAREDNGVLKGGM